MNWQHIANVMAFSEFLIVLENYSLKRAFFHIFAVISNTSAIHEHHSLKRCMEIGKRMGMILARKASRILNAMGSSRTRLGLLLNKRLAAQSQNSVAARALSMLRTRSSKTNRSPQFLIKTSSLVPECGPY